MASPWCPRLCKRPRAWSGPHLLVQLLVQTVSAQLAVATDSGHCGNDCIGRREYLLLCFRQRLIGIRNDSRGCGAPSTDAPRACDPVLSARGCKLPRVPLIKKDARGRSPSYGLSESATVPCSSAAVIASGDGSAARSSGGRES